MPLHPIIAILIVVLVPEIAVADSGEGLLEITAENLRIMLLYMLIATATAVTLSIRISRYIRDFNDSHE